MVNVTDWIVGNWCVHTICGRFVGTFTRMGTKAKVQYSSAYCRCWVESLYVRNCYFLEYFKPVFQWVQYYLALFVGSIFIKTHNVISFTKKKKKALQAFCDDVGGKSSKKKKLETFCLTATIQETHLVYHWFKLECILFWCKSVYKMHLHPFPHLYPHM